VGGIMTKLEVVLVEVVACILYFLLAMGWI